MDDSALEREIERLHEASFAWALSLCRWDRQEAEDVLQTTYLKVIDGRARFDGRASVKTWLFAVIRKTAADARRRSIVRRLLWAEPEAPAPTGERTTDQARARAALSQLAPRQREVLDLVFFHDLTIEEASKVMRVSLGSARVHYERGKARLREILG